MAKAKKISIVEGWRYVVGHAYYGILNLSEAEPNLTREPKYSNSTVIQLFLIINVEIAMNLAR